MMLPFATLIDRYWPLVHRLREAVLGVRGALAPSLRRAIEARAASFAGGPVAPVELPPPLMAYVDKVAQFAYRVEDEDVQALREAGFSDAAIFEATVSAAIGTASSRLDRALGALRQAS